MRLASVHIVNFRCLRDLAMSLDDVTVLVGANSTGKSTVLHALAWFFRGGSLTEEDISGHQSSETVSVSATFTCFNDSDRVVLGAYVLGEEATFWRTWSAADGEKLSGKGRSYPAFAPVRAHSAAMAKRSAYSELRNAQPELGLPSAGSAGAVDAALAAWEADHPDQLEVGRTDATHLFGATGTARLAQRIDFVLVPAVADPETETTDARGTLLRQLLDRSLGEQSVMRERLAELEQRVSGELATIMDEEGGAALSTLSGDVSEQLAQLVPGGAVLLGARPPSVRVPSLSVDVRVSDEGLSTAVARQGHGFQRALLIAIVQQLAVVAAGPGDSDEVESEAPTSTSRALILALEEPELYQHPLQARHFAATLAALAEVENASVQVCYATHSEHFVDPAYYERLRRFQRRQDVPWPQSQVAHASVNRVVARLADVFDPEQVPLRVQMTLRRQVAEAVFARTVVLVEGDSDAGLLQGVADRSGGLDPLGIAVVKGHNKRQLLIPWAILSELGVPAYVVFDGDGGLRGRMLAKGRSETDADAAQQAARDENALVLRALGAEAVEEPPTQVNATHAVFADTLETELAAWAGFAEAVERFKHEHGDFREKPDDAYRHAAATLDTDPPAVFLGMLERVRTLAA
jgi:putative ATP-dependent endonuclease of OLD family